MKLPRIVRQVGKRVVKAAPILRRHILTSSDYRVLDGIDEARSLTASSAGWLARRTVMRQERAYQGLIAAMKAGQPRLDFKVAAEAIAAAGIVHPKVLEVGCGSGYYSEVLATLLPAGVQYTGIDYSDAMIARARAHYPSTAFEVADATRLPYADGAFDIVFNGVSLMHIVDYQGAIREAARVAAHCCILHTVPVFDNCRTTFLTKYAYGAPVVEIIFGKQELMSLCNKSGLRLEHEWACIPYDVSEVTGHHSTTETYLFSKRTKS
jgi:ubiquinone/menaquinone biosynthesis C-methylase UbiE